MASDGWAIAVIFLLISHAPPGIDSNKFEVSQKPPSIEVCEGDTVTLSCYFQAHGVASYTWDKDCYFLDFKAQRYNKRIVGPDADLFKSKGDASIQIKNMSLVDSGLYRCNIDAMGTGKGAGSGTLVIVRGKEKCAKANKATSSLPEWIWIAVTGGGAFLIILLLVVVIGVLARRNKAYALLVRECSSFDSAKEPIAAPRKRTTDHPNHQLVLPATVLQKVSGIEFFIRYREDAYLHCHGREVAPKRKRPTQPGRNVQ